MNMVMTGNRREKKSIFDYKNREILRILPRCFYLKDREIWLNEINFVYFFDLEVY